MLNLLINFIKNIFFFTGSYSNTVFKDPLTSDEEEKYITLMQQGDKEARNILIEHNLRLVAHIVKKFNPPLGLTDDLISIGTIGLIKGIDSYQSNKNIKITTYAARCIENEILMYLRKANPQKNEISIDEPLRIDWDGNELLLSDVLGTENDLVNRGIEDKAEWEMIVRCIDQLEDRERSIMKMRFGMLDGVEHTQKEVADQIGISQSYISRLEKKIIKRLRKEMERVGI